MPDYASDHDFITFPSEKGEGLLHAACTCGWASRVNLKTEKAARVLWREHKRQIMYFKPRTKG